jgi:hypothetical protein
MAENKVMNEEFISNFVGTYIDILRYFVFGEQNPSN